MISCVRVSAGLSPAFFQVVLAKNVAITAANRRGTRAALRTVRSEAAAFHCGIPGRIDLSDGVTARKSRKKDWQRTFGLSRGDDGFKEMVNLGQQYRRSLRDKGNGAGS